MATTVKAVNEVKAEEAQEIRIYLPTGMPICWQGEGTYYMLERFALLARILSIKTLDFEIKRGTSLIHVEEKDTRR